MESNSGYEEFKRSREAVLELVKKCLALAQSPNEHEAAAAMERARKIMLKYNIDMFEVERRERKINDIWERNQVTNVKEDLDIYEEQDQRWRQKLAAAVASHFWCKVVWHNKTGERAVTFIGRVENIDAALDVYWWMADIILDKVTEAILTERPKRARIKPWWEDYAIGIVDRIQTRLEYERSCEGHIEGSQALTVKYDTENEAKMHEIFPHLGYGRGINARGYGEAYQAGRRAGDNIPLRPVKLVHD